ncbi:hypothetical protein MKW92_012069 [Papaver armeniacum]|nr:hypothetical protein MKW92_012069 [Papaver armeniacum]
MNAWSRTAKEGSNHHNISPLPIFEPRWSPVGTTYPIRLPFSSIDELFVETSTPPPFEERIFYFTPENIARLKKKTANLSTTDGITQIISSIHVVLAHVWVAVTRARRLNPNKTTSCKLVIGSRARLYPQSPDAYFGSAFISGAATTKSGELLERGSEWGALLLRQVTVSCNNDAIQSYWKSWIEKPVLHSIHDLDLLSFSNLRVGSSPRFNVFGNDFGWGRPVALLSGVNNKYEGKILTEPGPAEGIISIDICLSFGILKALPNDVEFMEFATIPQEGRACDRFYDKRHKSRI